MQWYIGWPSSAMLLGPFDTRTEARDFLVLWRAQNRRNIGGQLMALVKSPQSFEFWVEYRGDVYAD